MSAGVRRVIRSAAQPATQPADPSAFLPHQADDAAIMQRLYGVIVERDDEAIVPGGVATPYGVFGPVERIAGTD